MTIISIIVAMDEQGVIGVNGGLPWRLSDDLKHFKKITMGHPIVMGRKTYDSIGHPLPGRENIILTRQTDYHPEGTTIIHNLKEIIGEHETKNTEQRTKNTEPETFIIGGSQIFKQALPLANKIYLTLIHKNFEGDTFFPEFDLEKDFQIIEKSEILISEKNHIPYQFITAIRN